MSKEEKILLGMAFVALVAVVIFQRPVSVVAAAIDTSGDPVSGVGYSITPNNDSVTRGPSYMTYNAPFYFAPPVSNFLPSITAGLGSQTINSPTNFAGDGSCGCE